jgi:hypothetical protein
LLLAFCSWLGLKLLVRLISPKKRANMGLIAYCLVLVIPTGIYWAIILLPRNHAIFYFPAPFHSYESIWISIMAYWPALLALALLATPFIYKKLGNAMHAKLWDKLPILGSLVLLLISTLAFGYWGMLIVV